MARKGENIYQRLDGRWEGRYISGYDTLSGKIQYGYVYASSYTEAKRIKQKVEKGKGKLRKQKLTVAGCFMEWMRWKKTDPNLHPSTLNLYDRNVEKHILPLLGSCKVHMITAQSLDQFRWQKLKDGRLDGGGGLSPVTVDSLMFLIYSMLQFALEEHYILEIPKRKMKRSSHGDSRNIRVFSTEEQSRIEETLFRGAKRENARSTCLGILFALYTGLRVGELSGLQWRDVDMGGYRIFVRRTLQRVDAPRGAKKKTMLQLGPPKSNSSIRSFPVKDELMTWLSLYRNSLPELQRQPDSPVFSTAEGGYIEPRVFQKRFGRILEAAQVEEANFHALRHTFATRCIESNMDVQSLSECLGHSSGVITLKVYTHSFSEHKRSCINRLEFLMAEQVLESVGAAKCSSVEENVCNVI